MENKVLVPSKVISMMTGVHYISQKGNKATLHYTDGNTEIGVYKTPIQDAPNFFDIVSTIQSQRKS